MASLTVADNHQFLHEAYVADKLVKDIHKLLKLHPKGIPLDKFTALFEVCLHISMFLFVHSKGS